MMSFIDLAVSTYLHFQELNKPVKPVTAVIQGRIINRSEVKDNHKKWVNIIATAYSSSSDECGNSLGITASGTKASYSRGTIATPHSIPFQTKLHIPELNKTYVTEDRGNPRYIKWIDENTVRIDIFMNSKSEAKKFGVQKFSGYFIIDNPDLSINAIDN